MSTPPRSGSSPLLTAPAAEALFGVWGDGLAASQPAFDAWLSGRANAAAASGGRVRRFRLADGGAGVMLLAELRGLSNTAAVPTWLHAAGARGVDGVESARYRLRVARASRGSGDLFEAPYILSVRLFVPEQWRADVRAWLDEEHYGAHLKLRGCSWYHGYESLDGPFNFLNLWGLDSPGVIDTPEWAAARDTPWRGRLLPAFARTGRAVYRPGP